MMNEAWCTYIRVPPDGLDGVIIEMAGVTGESRANRVCVLETLKKLFGEWKLATLP